MLSGASLAEVAAGLARLVCSRLGGPVGYDEYEAYDAPHAQIDALRAESGSRVVPLGSISLGAAIHRAVLFKVLADRAGLPASLALGACVRCRVDGAVTANRWALEIQKRVDEHAERDGRA